MAASGGLGLRWTLGAEAIAKQTEQLIRTNRAALDRIAAVADPSFEAILGAWSCADGEAATLSCELTLPGYCAASGDSAERRGIRAASNAHSIM